MRTCVWVCALLYLPPLRVVCGVLSLFSVVCGMPLFFCVRLVTCVWFSQHNGARSYTPMMTACALSHQETAAAIVDLLISECGFMQFDATDKDGFTCLHWAAACGGAPVVTRLLAEKPGPRIDARSVSGDTPLMRAARLGRTGCVKLLVQAGADVRAMNKAKHTALDVAGIYKERRSPTLRKTVRKVGAQHPRQ